MDSCKKISLWFLAMTMVAIVFVPDIANAGDESEWSWITTCSFVSNKNVVFTEKSRWEPTIGFTFIAFRDVKTNDTYYRYLMGEEILCLTMTRDTYDSRR